MRRKQNFQPIAWFWDLFLRKRLELDPPYQRRSVWNQAYRDYFIDTLLLGYPAPAIFLFEEITPEGLATYNVVDGKQRLTCIFSFVKDEFPVSGTAERTEFRDRYFSDLPDETKRDLWGYQFSVEYVPTEEEAVINNIFDRINRNTAKLSRQELRKAKFDGEFITAVKQMSERLFHDLPEGFPNIAVQSRRQMKDDEFTAHLLLMIESGPRGYPADELDEAFSQRDEGWDNQAAVIARFERVLQVIRQALDTQEGQQLPRTRLRNQADFYSFFGAIDRTLVAGALPDLADWVPRLLAFVADVDDEKKRQESPALRRYYDAARSASSDTGPRIARVDLVEHLILGKPLIEN